MLEHLTNNQSTVTISAEKKQHTDFGVCGVLGVKRDWLSSALATAA